MNNDIAIGADIGGSHINCAAVDLSTHTLINGTHSECRINNKASADEILSGWAKALSGTISKIEKERLVGIGFAMPGPFDYPNGIALFERVEKYENLYGINVTNELRTRLNLGENISFRYINDATSFAIAEAWIGKAENYGRVMALTLGTGFGSAFLDKGIPVLEGEGIPEYGCLWHLPFKNGIADDYFSTRWFLRNYAERSGKNVAGVKEIADAAVNDLVAESLFVEYGHNMGNFLAPWVKAFEARVIVIGGNVTGAFDLFGPHLLKTFADHHVNPDVFISELKEDAAIIGCARLISDVYWPGVKDLLSKM